MAPEIERITARSSPVDEGDRVRLDVVTWNPGASVVWEGDVVLEDRTDGTRELGRVEDVQIPPIAQTTSVRIPMTEAGTRRICARVENARPTNFPWVG